jgi:hypothetical protein
VGGFGLPLFFELLNTTIFWEEKMKRKLTTEISTRELNKMKREICRLELSVKGLNTEATRLKRKIHDFIEEVEFWHDATRRLLEESLT